MAVSPLTPSANANDPFEEKCSESFVSVLHSLNAEERSVTTEFTVTPVRRVQLRNAAEPTLVTLEGRTIDLKLLP